MQATKRDSTAISTALSDGTRVAFYVPLSRAEILDQRLATEARLSFPTKDKVADGADVAHKGKRGPESLAAPDILL
jgi:hypothetical protein